jgi:hypothetical protein
MIWFAGCFCLLAGFSFPAFGQDPTYIYFFDQDPRFPELLADPMASRLAVLFLANTHDEKFYRMNVGTRVGLVKPMKQDWVLEGKVNIVSRFSFTEESFPFENADFEGGMVLNILRNPDWVELYGYHRSSHLGGDVVYHDHEVPGNVSAEFLRVLYSKVLSPESRLYLGPSVVVHSDPAKYMGNIGLQGGGEWVSSHWVAGLDLKVKDITMARLDVSALAGINLSPPGTRFEQILHLFFYTGHMLGGQFQDGYENVFGFGLLLR